MQGSGAKPRAPCSAAVQRSRWQRPRVPAAGRRYPLQDYLRRHVALAPTAAGLAARRRLLAAPAPEAQHVCRACQLLQKLALPRVQRRQAGSQLGRQRRRRRHSRTCAPSRCCICVCCRVCRRRRLCRRRRQRGHHFGRRCGMRGQQVVGVHAACAAPRHRHLDRQPCQQAQRVAQLPLAQRRNGVVSAQQGTQLGQQCFGRGRRVCFQGSAGRQTADEWPEGGG